jgi:alpha-D-ribose 1-methylphosphonate 5-triphosphate synthase subunit PhnI
VQNLQLAFQLEDLGAGGIASMHKKLSGGQVLGPMQNRFVYVHRMAAILNAGQATCYVNQTKFSEVHKKLEQNSS